MSLQYIEDFAAEAEKDNAVWGLEWTTNGVVAAHAAGNVTVWDPADGSQVASYPEHKLGIVSLSRARDESLLTCSADGCVVLWYWKESQLYPVAKCESLRNVAVDGVPFGAEAWATALHPNDKVFAAASGGSRLGLFSADPRSFGTMLRSIPVEGLDRDAFGLVLSFVCIC